MSSSSQAAREQIIELSQLGVDFFSGERLAEAGEPLQRALQLAECEFGRDSSMTADCLNNLAEWHRLSGRPEEAEPLYRRAVALKETIHGADDAEVATPLNNLALLLRQTDRAPEAEPLYRRVLGLLEQQHGRDDIHLAGPLNNLAQVLAHTGRQAEAEEPMRRALAIFEGHFGPAHPHVGVAVNNLARLLEELSRGAEAEPFARRQVEIFQAHEEATGQRHAYKTPAISYYHGLVRRLGYRRRQAQARLFAIFDGQELPDLTAADRIPDEIPDFDQLSADANETEQNIPGQAQLYAAVFRLPRWQFICRGEMPNVQPYVATNASLVEGAPMLKAFTDSERLQAFAFENGLGNEDGSVQILSLPVEGILPTLESYRQQGVTHIHFNADRASDGFFAPLAQLPALRSHLEAEGLVPDLKSEI